VDTLLGPEDNSDQVVRRH